MIDSQVSVQMPQYQCHKKVWALKIKEVTDPTIPGNETDGSRILHFVRDDCYGPTKVSHEYVRKHNPKPGGYFVVYEDGYESWSPAEAFEEGYTLIGGKE